jgi:hypothetical protein
MNERIKEIALQAGGSHYPDVGGKTLELFASLLIKECVDIIENLTPGYDDYRNQIEDAFRRDCITNINYRFGVSDGQIKSL